MVLEQDMVKTILDFVKKEPRTVNDVAKFIGKSWVTTESYILKIKDSTGLISLKTFRKGSQAALKIVYFNNPDAMLSDEVRDHLHGLIKMSRTKDSFDFMDVFQHIDESKKHAYLEKCSKDSSIHWGQLERANKVVYCFSGNLSFINSKKNHDAIVALLKRNVAFKILCRINHASVANLEKFNRLIVKYPGLIEIRHRYHPLRGFVIDNDFASFKSEEVVSDYKLDELDKDTRVFYEINDADWVAWFQKVFWNMFRSSVDHGARMKEVKDIL